MTDRWVVSLNAATQTWSDALKRIRTEDYFAPRNLVAERGRTVEALTSGRRYDPEFLYDDPPEESIDLLRVAARQIRVDHPITERLVLDLEESADLLLAARRRDNAAITRVTVHSFGTPPPVLVADARSLLQTYQEPARAEADHDAAAAAELLRSALARSGLSDWTVLVESRMSARMSVRSSTSEVRVNTDARFSDAELDRLVVHELGTHVARAVNGRSQPVELLGVGIPGYLATEEGLAVWHEQKWLGLDAATMRRYALRVLAIDSALQAGFWETFEMIAEFATPEEAFSLVQRAKRGLKDLRSPGSHVKDQVYLRGFREVEAHLNSHPDDYDLLMSGKVGIRSLGLVAELARSGQLQPVRLTPGSFRA